jgi:hypothetical protein
MEYKKFRVTVTVGISRKVTGIVNGTCQAEAEEDACKLNFDEEESVEDTVVETDVLHCEEVAEGA